MDSLMACVYGEGKSETERGVFGVVVKVHAGPLILAVVRHMIIPSQFLLEAVDVRKATKWCTLSHPLTTADKGNNAQCDAPKSRKKHTRTIRYMVCHQNLQRPLLDHLGLALVPLTVDVAPVIVLDLVLGLLAAGASSFVAPAAFSTASGSPSFPAGTPLKVGTSPERISFSTSLAYLILLTNLSLARCS